MASTSSSKNLTISDEQVPFAKEVFKKLQEAGIRVEIDTRVEKIGYKIREANGDQKYQYN